MTALGSTSWVGRRAEARALFEGHGLPTRRVEEWKYSDLKAALNAPEKIGEESAGWTLGALPPGVESFDLAGADVPDWALPHMASNPMGAASLAFARAGVALRVSGAVTEPLRLDLARTGHLRLVLVLEPGASATLVEQAAAAAWRNVGVDIVLGEGARLDHIRLSPAAPQAVLVAEYFILVAAQARYHGHFADFGARLSRAELQVALAGEGAAAHLSGVAVLDAKRHADVTTHIIHRKGGTRSTQLFKNVAGGGARAVYQGKVTVAKGADGSDSLQTAKALLLSETAEADLKPELEIFADDVKCAHGAAVGDLDADSLFYLRTRGIPEAEARALLIHAFLEDALDAIAAEDMRGGVREAVGAALAGLA
jgi:Fe-S cluster assembly protein SufD